MPLKPLSPINNSCYFGNPIAITHLKWSEGSSQSCLVLAVTLVLHAPPQPGDALLPAPLPQDQLPPGPAEEHPEVARARAVHVVVEVEALRPPGGPQWAGQQPHVPAGQQSGRLQVQVVACRGERDPSTSTSLLC